MTEDEICKAKEEATRVQGLSDIDLHIEAEHLHPLSSRGPAEIEIRKRQIIKQKNDEKTQQKIKNMTAIILVLTIIILCFTVAQFIISHQVPQGTASIEQSRQNKGNNNDHK